MDSRKKVFARMVSLILVIILMTNITTPALAVLMDTSSAKGVTLTDSNGNTVTADESWEETFPYGTFAFHSSQLSTAEGAKAQTIQVYRLGGTKGKAQIALTLSPVVTELDDGTYSYANAAGTKDFTVEVEDSLPITDYQAYGYDEQPKAPETAVTVSAVAEESTENSTDEAGETVYGHTVLTADVNADSYRWQALSTSGWQDVEGTERTLDVDNEAVAASDFRCIYTVGGVQYCTTSYGGTAYVAEDNTAKEVPEDLELNPEQSFHTLELKDGEFDTYEFYMTFAEGEWVKEIRITPTDDAISENVELVTMKIDSCKGGELYDAANTMLVSIEDNDKVLPSYFAFETSALTVDKAAGTASLKVKRTGALQYVATVDYHTVDGTAIAGKDYSSTSGTLYFAADMDEMTIDVPLINDGAAVAEANKTFTVVLDNAKGGGEETAINAGTATVKLFNTAVAEETNLATMLYTPEADDVSGNTETTQSAIAEATDEVVTATPVPQGEDTPVEAVFGSSGDVSALTYDATALLKLSGGGWNSYADLDSMSDYWGTNNEQGLNKAGWSGQTMKDYTITNGSYKESGFYGFYVEDVTGDNNSYSRVATQNVTNFDQQFDHVYARYYASTNYNWLDTFWTTARGGIAPHGSGKPEMSFRDTPGWRYGNASWDVNAGATGIFLALGIADKGWADTGSPNGEVYIRARAQRRYLTQPLQYKVHTADDDMLSAEKQTALYQQIAPEISVAAGKGGTYAANQVYIGTQLLLSAPQWATYSYATKDVNTGSAVYLSSSNGTKVTSGTVDGSANLNILADSGKTFATGAGANTLSLSDQYTVNVVLNRSQKIAIDVRPSVPRKEDGLTMDDTKIGKTISDFWNTSKVKITYAVPDKSGNGKFTQTTKTLTQADFSADNTVLTSALAQDNVRSINFGLPAEDQILLNGVQYNGNADIPIPVSSFGMGTLAFTYYNKDYVSVPSSMTMIIGRIEHYIDMNGNGQLDGAVNQNNVFELDAVDGKKDQLVQTLTKEEYTATTFTPVYDEDGNIRQQFLKFYYNMTPRCLTVPSGASINDRAQILPAFVTSITDASDKEALSAEMQGYRFITSSKYSKDASIYNGKGETVDTKTAGSWTGDNKLMYQASANATETVDIPLGGDYYPAPATYVYSDGSQTNELLSDAELKAKNITVTDVKFERSRWNPDYRGNLLYQFSNPEPVFVSDSLVGENLPVADIVTKAGENGATADQYNVSKLNGYLGSLNPLDTVSLCIRPQEGRTTDIIQGWFSTEGLSTLDIIQSGEYQVEVDSTRDAGFKAVPDASGLRRMAGPEDGSSVAGDSGSSSNSMPEFNVDLGIELPSLSAGLTDYVTLIMDGSEFGFSIGIPVFKAEKSKEAYTSSDEKYGTTKPAYGDWEKSGPIKENWGEKADATKGIEESRGNLKKIKDAFANPGELIKGDDWKAAKDAQAKSLDSDKLIKSKGLEFSVAVNVTVMFKYSAPDHAYKFTSAMVFLQFGFEFKMTFRLTVCPIVYAYFVVGASLELAGGVVNEREVVENKEATLDIKQAYGVGSGTGYDQGKIVRTATNLSTGGASSWKTEADEAATGKDVIAGTKGDALTFISKSDALNLYFKGKVKVEWKDGTTWKNLGYVASDGSDPAFVMFDEKVDGTANLEVRVTVLDEDANIDRIVPISGVRNDTFFSGLSLSPSIFLEVGAGVGVEVMKIEIYFKASIGCSMSFATRENNAATKGSQLRDPSSSSVSVAGVSNNVVSDDEVSALGDDKVEPFIFNSMTFRAGFGVRVVLLLFNFELDAIQFGIDYNRGQNKSVNGGKDPEDGFHDNGWKFAWYVLNGSQTIGSYDLNDVDDSDGFPGIKITLPSNTFAAQQIYGPDEAKMALDEIDALAFDPDNLPTNEFQISGYSSSGDAFRLSDKLSTGTDYKLLTVGDENYVLYTISRDNPANQVDSNMFVLSRVKNTGESVGLVNPVDEGNKEQPYIIVDDDGTGDLDFTASVTGSTIYAAWASYAGTTEADGSTSSAPMPGSDVARPSYMDGETEVFMDATNFDDARFVPALPEGGVVAKPSETLTAPTAPEGDEITEAPVRTAYYLTPDEYAALEDAAKAAYALDEAADPDMYYAADKGASYAAAKQAFDDAEAAYKPWSEYHLALARFEANQAAWEKYNAFATTGYAEKKAAFDAWSAYYNGEKTTAKNEQQQLANSAKNTVIKNAAYTVGDNAFSTPKQVSSGTGSYVFLPAASNDGKLTFYARTNNYSAEEKTAATTKAKDYYNASRGDVSTSGDGVSTGEGDPSAGFRYAYTTSMDDVYGKNTQFMFSYPKADGTLVHTGFTPEGWEASGMRLDHCTMTMLDDTTFYLAYTASQTQTQTNGSSYGDKTVHKLYLQKGSVDSATGKVTLDTAKMLRQLVDINDMGLGAQLTSGLSMLTGSDSTQTADGVYANRGSGAQQIEAFEDPYFGNIRFLYGKLGNLTGESENFGEDLAFNALGEGDSLFMVFEMNGATYVVPQNDLGTITSTGTGAIIPFFTASEDNRTRGNVAIGTDGEGNISAVYTDTVPSTTNNAIYVAKYDPNTMKFGEGRMLAMNYMQVYEDSVANGWSAEDTERAYYGKLDGYQNGGMSSFTFANLNVALGLKKTVSSDSVSASSIVSGEANAEASEDYVAAAGVGEEPTNSGNKSTLVILTQGTQTALEEKEFLDAGESTKIIMPKYDDSGALQSSTGYYALSFGVGEKNVGEGQIRFAESNFVPGAILRPVIEFKNTGDVPLLGSKTEPITLELHISGKDGTGEGEKLAEWKIEDTIAVGQTMNTGLANSFYTSALPSDLESRKFYFTVQETGRSAAHPNGVDDPLVYSSLSAEGGTTKTIEATPELAVENLKFSTVGVEGDQVKISVSMEVTNRGGADSAAPYLQFTYQSGRTMETVNPGDTDYQQAVYSALNIRSSQLEISNQVPLETFGDSDDKEQGILRLVGKDGADLKKNYSRTVTGTILVSKDAYCQATATGSLNLKVTVFDSNTTISSLSSTGVQSSGFDNEYNAVNNADYQELEPQSFFTAPDKIAVPLSTTMRLSVPVTTTEKGNPVISVSELNSQALETTEKHLGVLYYNMGTDGTGKNGYVVISPSSEGSGIIRVSDMATNTWKDIAYTVTKSGTGVNIFKDNDIFSWYNARGQKIDPETDQSGVWIYQQNVMNWGSGTSVLAVPYLGDVSRTNTRGASFSFSTLAEKIDLYFDGTVTVKRDSTNLGSFTATGGEGAGSFATIDLGANPSNEALMVTVTADSSTVAVDRMIETFSKNQDILPDVGGEEPQIYFSRILPETASLNPADYKDSGFKLTVYMLDNVGLVQPAFASGTSGATTENTRVNSEQFRQFDVLVKKNGTFTVQVSNVNGKTTTRTVTVDWFNDPVSAADQAVPLKVSMLYRDTAGNPIAGIADTDQLAKNQYAFAQIATDADAAVTVQYYSANTVSVTTSYELVEKNGGWKLVKTVAEYDANNQLIGEPTVTETDASATTEVPKTSVVSKTQGTWTEVPATASESDVYPIAQNAVYKVTAMSAGKGTSSTNMFLMNRLNTDLPSIETAYTAATQDAGDTIGYVVRKGKSSQQGIESVAINGYSVFAATGGTRPNSVVDSFPITYGGAYQFAAKDGANNEQVYNMNVSIPIRALSGDVAAVTPSWSQVRNNGIVSVDPAKLVGGVYDASLSNPSANAYGNAYQFALVAAADQFAETMPDTADMTAEETAQAINAYHAAFDAYADALKWQDATQFTDLVPGAYVLYTKDKAETAEASTPEDYLITPLTVPDAAIAFTAVAKRSSEAGVRTITVNATGGSGDYEFFVMKRDTSSDLLDAAGIAQAIAEDDGLNWKTSGTDTHVFVGCQYGWNQVAVRDKNNPENLYTEMVRMRRPSTDSPVVTTPNELTEAEQKELIEKNRDEDVTVKTDTAIVIIPAGTLSAGDNVNDMIVTLPDALSDPQSANVVQCTGADGKTVIMPWCMVSGGKMIYIASMPGKYSVTSNAKAFSDVNTHWALDSIDFVTARELFNGTGEGVFTPDLSMTRGMFVTVLGRMEGADVTTYTAKTFDDVALGEWYAPYVEWATKNGVISGYGNGKFGPNDAITREQMAVILMNYAEMIGQDTTAVGDVSGFADRGKISDWAKTQVSWAIGAKLMNGKSDTLLDPAGQATRAEVSTILRRFMETRLLGYDA